MVGATNAGAAVHDPMSDGGQVLCIEAQSCGCLRQGFRMGCRSAGFADFFDEPAGQRFERGVEEPVLDRRRAAVQDEDHALPAWMAVIAMVLTMSATVAPRDRSLTGFRRPCMTGPIATAPAERWTAL